MLRAVRVHVLGWEDGVLREMVDLTLRPGRTVARALRPRPGTPSDPGEPSDAGAAAGAARSESSPGVFTGPLRIFLLANLFFFLIGPSVGLLDFTLDSLSRIPLYAEAARAQIARLGVEVDVYRERFDASFRFRQPTFVILLVPVLAVWSKVLAPRTLFGRHLVLALLLLAWVLIAWPLLKVGGAVATRPLPDAWGLGLEAMQAVLLLGITLLAARTVASSALGRRGWRGWATGAALTAGVVAALAAYGHLVFWMTYAVLETGG